MLDFDEFNQNLKASDEFWREQFKRRDEQKKEEEEYKKLKKLFNNFGSGTNTSSGSGFGSVLIILVLAAFPLYLAFMRVYRFIKENWASIVIILAICAVCAIVCFILYHLARKAALKMLIAILAAAGLIGVVLFSGPKKTEAFLVTVLRLTPQQEQKAINKPTADYAYVTADALNVRSGPSDRNEIIGRLSKDQRVEIVDSSGQWWKIKAGNIEGYAASNFLLVKTEGAENE